MKNLIGKHILMGLCGGIAAYKAAECVRLLRKAGADVRVVMTEHAKQFITPLTLHAVSGQPVRDALFDSQAEAAMGHIELARWADMICIAPASAHIVAKLAHGLADDLLTTLCLATPAPMMLAPAMNQHMWAHPATQANINILRERGICIVGPMEGEQACGDVGLGRMMEAADIVENITKRCAPQTTYLRGKKIIITAGPTQEPIDPVRYVSNHSSGKMGYALAAAAHRMGADVILISGPVALSVPNGVQVIPVVTAQDMAMAVQQEITACDIFIAAAAVSDYRCVTPQTKKIKKQHASLSLQLTRNPDILAQVAQQTQPPFTVGFAAETDHVLENARQKLQAKNIDMIIANQVNVPDSGFGGDTNTVTMITEHSVTELPPMLKTQLAKELMLTITEKYHAKHSTQNFEPALGD